MEVKPCRMAFEKQNNGPFHFLVKRAVVFLNFGASQHRNERGIIYGMDINDGGHAGTFGRRSLQCRAV